MTFFILLTNQVLLPSVFLAWFYFKENISRSNFILEFIFTGSLIGFAWIVGPQSWTSVYIGMLLVLFFLITFIRKILSLSSAWDFKLGDNWKEITFTITQILISLVFLPICLFGLSGYSFDSEREAIDLEFPMKDGVYIVGHGGDNPLINYHNVSESQKYSLDISKLNAFGTRSKGVYPTELEKYAIFDEPLYSPCSGIVKDVTKGYEDLNVPERGEGHPAGNHVVLRCNEVDIYIAHMKENSIVVDSASSVQTGDLLGRVGNTGNTSEPHLHIHAQKEGKGIPIVFDGRFLVRNSLIWR